MVQHSFKKCGISNKLDGTEYDVLFDVCPGKAANVSDSDDSDSDADSDDMCLSDDAAVSGQRRRQWFWRILNGWWTTIFPWCCEGNVESDYVVLGWINPFQNFRMLWKFLTNQRPCFWCLLVPGRKPRLFLPDSLVVSPPIFQTTDSIEKAGKL